MEKQPVKKKEILERAFENSLIRYSLVFLLDTALICMSLISAYKLRFEGKIPLEEMVIFWRLLPWLIGTRVLAILVSQIHRWSFRFAGFYDAIRVVWGMMLGTLLFLSSVIILQLPYPPRSVVALEFFMSSLLLGGYRFAPRFIIYLNLERERKRGQAIRRSLIIGAGSSGELLLRDLMRSGEHAYKVIGFVDDDVAKVGKIIGGHRVLGTLANLPELVKKNRISDVLISIPKLDPKKVKSILDMCKDMKLRYKVLPVSFSYIKDKVSASMLQDLQPEDLLPRDSVAFEQREVKALVEGRTALVTGGAGSIGSETCRQLAAYGVKKLVMVDINENELYFLFREIQESYPDLEVFAEVADIRDRDKLFFLGRKYRPDDILHAAAHKHVPLMETAPEEAVKNNVFGTLNVADMAIDCGARKFVFISTDKAVNPSSVMGVTKRVGEFIVRERGKQGKTHFSAVRFGNVLGSAGSVVPLFKRQIAKGGPLTVTHPEMKRYFMTIEEAVGLVLLAGLGRYGDLCVLDMGEQIKITDLARHMISMAGLIPEQDIKIAYTGLRPGEKLQEDLMTEEEEMTQKAREKILVAKSLLPEGLAESLAELEKEMKSGDGAGIRRNLKKIVPRYKTEAL